MAAGQALINNLHETYPLNGVFLAPSGKELAQTEPEVIEAFVDTTHALLTSQGKPSEIEYMDRGNYAHIYGLPGHSGYCLKLVSQKTNYGTWKTGVRSSLPNLKTEARFMDTVGHLLKSHPEEGVSAPTQYAVVKFAGGAGLLQERIPDDFASLRRLSLEPDTTEELDSAREKAVLTKALRALGSSVLRWGMGDIYGEGG